MMKPAVVKKMDIAPKANTRARMERRLDRAARISMLLVLSLILDNRGWSAGHSDLERNCRIGT